MSALLPFVPPAAAILFACWFWFFNGKRGWFTTGELISWDAIVLVVCQLVWLIWF